MRPPRVLSAAAADRSGSVKIVACRKPAAGTTSQKPSPLAFGETQPAGKVLGHLRRGTLSIETAPGAEDTGSSREFTRGVRLIGEIEEPVKELCSAFAVYLLPARGAVPQIVVAGQGFLFSMVAQHARRVEWGL